MEIIDSPNIPRPTNAEVEFKKNKVSLGFSLGAVPSWYIITPEGVTYAKAMDEYLINTLRALAKKYDIKID